MIISHICLNYINTAQFYQSDSLIRISDVIIAPAIIMLTPLTGGALSDAFV